MKINFLRRQREIKLWGKSATKTYLCSWVTGQSGIRQDDEVGTIHKRSVADKVDFSDFIVGLHDGNTVAQFAVRAAGIA